MRNLLPVILAFSIAVSAALGHGKVEVGPNGGRILEFSDDESMHGELTVKDGKFHVELLDKDMKPVAIKGQALTVTGGERQKLEKPAVTVEGNHFVASTTKEGEWVIFQYRESAKSKPITARVEYDTKKCGDCKNPEWLCKCTEAKK